MTSDPARWLAAVEIVATGMWVAAGIVLCQHTRGMEPFLAWQAVSVVLALLSWVSVGGFWRGQRRMALVLTAAAVSSVTLVAWNVAPRLGVAWYFSRHELALQVEAQHQVVEKRLAKAPPIALVQDPQGLGYVFVYDPEDLLPRSEAEGKNATSVFGIAEQRLPACSKPAPHWYHCVVS